MNSWFNFYRRRIDFDTLDEFNNLKEILKKQGWKINEESFYLYKDEIPNKELEKIGVFKRKNIIVYDDLTGTKLTDNEIIELDEFKNTSLYPATITSEEGYASKEKNLVHDIVDINSRKSKLRLPLSPALRKAVLKRDKGKCTICGLFAIKTNQVHHIDGNPSNNSMENLATICYECHITKHQKEI